MKTISIYKAQPTHGDDEIPSVTIEIAVTLPEGHAEAAAGASFRAEAVKIADALQGSLPGGTLAALLVELLERETNIRKVRMIP